MRLARGLAAGATLLAAAGCAQRASLPRFDLEGWKELRDGRVEIVGDASEADLRRLADDLALFVAVAGAITNARTAAERLPTRILLLDNAAVRQLRLTGLGGFMAPLLDGYLAMVRLEGGRVSPATRQVLFHEYTHFLLHNGAAVAYPRWYHEGFAELLSTVRRREDLIEVGLPPQDRAVAFARQRGFDLATVFAPESYADIDDPGRFYAGAWATVHYLNASEARGEQLERFLALLVSGVGWSDAYPQAFDEPLAELSREVLAHGRALAGGAPFAILALDARRLEIASRPEVRALAPAEAAAALGEFWLRLAIAGDPDEEDEALAFARGFFERSLALGPEGARTRAGLALCLALQGALDSAAANAARALAVAPDDAQVQALAGEVDAARARSLADDGDADGAAAARLASRAAFVRATALAPEDPVAWAGLGASWLGSDGDLAPGIAALERARELGAWSAPPTLALAQLYLASGQRGLARVRLEEVVRRGEGASAEAAEELLAGLDAEAPPGAAAR